MPAPGDTVALSLTALLVAALDQWTKSTVSSTIGPQSAASSIRIAGNWLTLEYAENRGVAFGRLAGLAPVLPVVALGIVGLLLWHFARLRQPSAWETLAIGAICGGAAGNLIDRFRLGYVIDFVSVGAWPNFNLADSAITLGAVALVLGRLVAGGRSDVRLGG